MSSLTTWQRLEPRTRSSTLDSIRARVHDPAWLLARQAQLGEFLGTDAGSAISVEAAGRTSRLTRYRPGTPADGAPPQPYPAGTPLEAVVEAETGQGPATSGTVFAAQAGQCFLRSLGPELGPRYRAAYILRHPLTAPPDPTALDDASLRLLDVLVGHVPDGHALYAELSAALRPPGGGAPVLPEEPPIAPADAAAVLATALSWLGWYERRRPASRPQAWQPERLAHRFAVAAPAPGPADDGEAVLSAPAFPGGRLDWHAFDVEAGASLGAAGATKEWRNVAIPTPVRFPGMPNARWWEFEDATNLGAVDAAPDDLGRLLLLEFALVYGNDFLYFPLDLDVGSLCWIDGLTVRTSFGERVGIRPVEKADGGAGLWSMFRLTRLTPSGRPERGDFLFLPPVLGPSLSGPALEEVAFVRDETANIVWAVEERIQTAAGTTAVPHELAEDRRRRGPAEEPPPAPGPALTYRMATAVPDPWYPLLPSLISRTVAGVSWNNVVLELSGTRAPRAQVLRNPGGTPLRVAEQEISATGAVVNRSWQRARWTDGSVHLWVGKRRSAGQGARTSGLRYDVVEELDHEETT
ncbi:hypothetical protein DEJ48_38920 [Streptomyces venezuelae]|uniref:Uncharacterized protein n=1 Tax=Streptomyces venezuelae TaxID=54571 RepID=A0A5P2C7F7_STRVZ|nr:hypothetical protein [Streptomyces venezuelae]QES38592.1 hypothetical protein DEJ48_38920 [Streptomyces venezuelae]